MTISRKRATAVMSASVGLAMLAALVAPSMAYAAEGDEVPVTPDSSVVDSANAQAAADAAALAASEAAAAAQATADAVAAEQAAAAKAEADAAAAAAAQAADVTPTEAPAAPSEAVPVDSEALVAPEAARTAPQTETTTPTPKVCVDGNALEWTDVSGESDPNGRYDLTVVELKLLAPFTTCDVSLYGYLTEGPTWETSGTQTPGDFDTVTLTTEQPTATLALDYEYCFAQNDLAIGKQKFDGVDGALPHYPDSSTPINLLDHWNGGEACTTPPPTPKVCTTLETGPTATDVNPAGWNSHDTRSTGVSEYVDGGYHLQTTDTANPASSQNKATLYKNVTPTPLAEFGEPSVEFAAGGSGVKPGMQVGIDVDGDGDWDGYLVGEPWSYGAHNWWINKPGFNVPSGNGYTSFGSWANFVAANPAAKVIEIGLSMGSGVLGDWTVTSFTAGCVVYTFDKYTPPVVAPASLAVSVVVTCGTASITFDNTIEDLKPGQTALAGEGTYTDANGAIQTVTVQPNSIEVITVRFPEDSGTHVVTAGVKGEVQNAYTVDTNCVPDTYPITPKGVYFHDGCGITDDSYGIENATKIPGSDETIVVDGVTYYSSAYTANDLSGTYYVNDYTDGDRSVFVAFVPFDRNAIITQPGEDDTYTIGDENVAVWEYTFSSEPCESTTPPTTPTPTPTPTPSPTPIPPTTVSTNVTPPKGLAMTGGDITGTVSLAALVLLAGAILVGVERRRRKTVTDTTGE